jgi:hypothetical protein
METFDLVRPADADRAAAAIARGAIVGHAFGNLYVISSRPDADVVQKVNLLKGQPADQVGSVTTTRCLMPRLFDWSRLPEGLTREAVGALIDRLYCIGPFGLRGPAAAHLPEHLASYDGDIRTTRLIAPGYACPSNTLLHRAMQALDVEYLHVTSGADDEPAHCTAAGLEAEFADEPDFAVVRHPDEAAARAEYPLHAPMSPTILAFHRLGGRDANGRPHLVVERHGSLSVAVLAPIVSAYGFGLELGPNATRRQAVRVYSDLAVAA